MPSRRRSAFAVDPIPKTATATHRRPWAISLCCVALAWVCTPLQAAEDMHGSHGAHGTHADPSNPVKPMATARTQAPSVGAAVKVEEAWLRPAVAGQTATGGYMRLTASADLTLLSVTSAAASETQLHEMLMSGDVMQMRESGPIALPAGQAVALQPGAGQRHLMLTGLKRPLKVGDRVQLVLNLRSADGQTFTQRVMVPVSARAPGAGAASKPDAGHEHHH
jgi:copper(I)-binding protein